MHSTSIVPAANADESRTPMRQLVAFLLHRRVRITVSIFVILIFEDVIMGFRPHDLLNRHDWHTVFGLSMVLGGLALRSWAAGILHKRTQLTTVGPYAVIRHPLYTGSLMMMVGFATLIDDPENIWLILGPVLAMYIMRAIHEECVLSAEFPCEWETYAESVPRFLPRRLTKSALAPWNLRQWSANHEYQAVSASILGLVALELWQRY
jgi:protein-S-isoprenylcysteine O-methyltransferase Ste14